MPNENIIDTTHYKDNNGGYNKIIRYSDGTAYFTDNDGTDWYEMSEAAFGWDDEQLRNKADCYFLSKEEYEKYYEEG